MDDDKKPGSIRDLGEVLDKGQVVMSNIKSLLMDIDKKLTKVLEVLRSEQRK